MGSPTTEKGIMMECTASGAVGHTLTDETLAMVR